MRRYVHGFYDIFYELGNYHLNVKKSLRLCFLACSLIDQKYLDYIIRPGILVTSQIDFFKDNVLVWSLAVYLGGIYVVFTNPSIFSSNVSLTNFVHWLVNSSIWYLCQLTYLKVLNLVRAWSVRSLCKPSMNHFPYITSRLGLGID